MYLHRAAGTVVSEARWPRPFTHIRVVNSPWIAYQVFPLSFQEEVLKNAPTIPCIFNRRQSKLGQQLCFFSIQRVGAATGVGFNNCSLRYTSELMSLGANSKPCPCVIASVGQAST